MEAEQDDELYLISDDVFHLPAVPDTKPQLQVLYTNVGTSCAFARR